MPQLVYAEDNTETNSNRIALANFETDQSLTFPQNWKVRGSEEIARIVYKVIVENGNHFLRAHADKQDVQIGISRSFHPKEFPTLQWRWRAKQLPTGANEQVLNTNDSVAGVYVIFDSTIVPRAIKYVWSSSLPVGTRFTSPVYWRSKIVVLESGPTQLNEWKLETVNFYHDYTALFGTEPGEVLGFAILTDSDVTKSIAEADYDDFAVLSVAAASAEEGNRTIVQRAPATAGGQ
jgi:Protein of unknown function (DUF3047)